MASRKGAVHVATTRRHYKGKVYETHLLRRSFRAGGKVKHETLGNLSHLPAETIELVRRSLRGEQLLAAGEAFVIERSLPHGHVAAVLGTARALELEPLLGPPCRQRELALALVCQRLLRAGSKLSATRQFALTTLGDELAVAGAGEAELLAAMDWLLGQQQRIESALCRRHLEPGGFVLYDLSSSYLEGTKCPLAALGYSRDGRRGTLQITDGLTCSPEGRPLAVEVFAGSSHDHQTLPHALERVRSRCGVERVVFVGDRGMITEAGIAELRAHGCGWITALKAKQVQRLARGGELQLSLFDQQPLAEIASDAFPGERLLVCRNPAMARERSQRRESLLQATERELAKVAASVDNPRGRLHGAGAGLIGERAGRVVNRSKVAKHFRLEIAAGRFRYARDEQAIAAEAALDGIYVLRTSLDAGELSAQAVVRAYKQLKEVERGFRAMKAPELQIRPVFHRLEERVRAHVFLCMLALHVRFELERRLTPLLFRDDAPVAAADPVAPAQRSAAAKAKAAGKRNAAGLPVQSLSDLLSELATLTRNCIRPHGSEHRLEQLAEATELQRRAFELLQLNPGRL